MSDDKTILKLIETVNPADTALLNNIDTCVSMYLANVKLTVGSMNLIRDLWMSGWDEANGVTVKKYTRSRDALKAIRPEGFWFSISQYGEWWHAVATYSNLPDDVVFTSATTVTGKKPNKTEELAELHAIIQAIAYERGQK